jgi:hypothetical protein
VSSVGASRAVGERVFQFSKTLQLTNLFNYLQDKDHVIKAYTKKLQACLVAVK